MEMYVLTILCSFTSFMVMADDDTTFTYAPTVVVDDIGGSVETLGSAAYARDKRPNKFIEEFHKADSFVDKTYLIKDIFSSVTADPLLIKCPPRFGKTTNLQMLKAFLQLHWDATDEVITNYTETPFYDLFRTTIIGQDEYSMKRHFAQYHVLYLDMSAQPDKSYANHSSRIHDSVRECILEHRWIMQKLATNRSALDDYYDNMLTKYFKILTEVASIESVGLGLRLTANLLRRFYDKPVVLLVDEFEAPLVDAVMSGAKNEEVLNIELGLNSLYGLTFKISPLAIRHAIFTSISSIIINRINFNYFSIYRFLAEHPFTKFCGFDQSEVDSLLDANQIFDERRRKAMKDFYHGYYVMRKNISVYNPLAVRKAVENHGALLSLEEARDPWTSSVSLGSVVNYLKCQEIHVLMKILVVQPYTKLAYVVPIPYVALEFANFIQNSANFTGVVEKKFQPDLFFTYLYERGYLSYNIKSRLFCFPNLEIKNMFTKLVEEHVPPSTLAPA